jgi:hypothetical protein
MILRNFINYFLTAAMVFIFLCVGGSSWAAGSSTAGSSEEDKSGQYLSYENEYGGALMGAPFAMRYAFSNETGHSWQDATYNERGQFIREWKKEEKTQAKAEKNRQKVIATEERTRAVELKQEELADKQKDRQEASRIRNEQLKQRQKDREFKAKLRQQQQTMKRMSR